MMRSPGRTSLLPVALAICALASAPARAAALEPVPLFTSVCVQGGGTMPAGSLAPVRYLAVPPGARIALSIGVPHPDWGNAALIEPLGPGQVPNVVDAVGAKGNIFLLLPAVGRRGAMAASCMVVWKGRHFDDARKAIGAITGVDTDDDSPIADTHRVDVTGEGFRMAASEAQGWTMLRATPDDTAHAPPQRGVGK